MRFMLLLRETKKPAGEPPAELGNEIMKMGIEAGQSGKLVDTAGFSPAGKRVTLTGGNLAEVDGTFDGSRASLAAYAIYDLSSEDEAVKWANRFLQCYKDHWPGWEGESEIRALFGPQ